MRIIFPVLILLFNMLRYIATIQKDVYYCGFEHTCKNRKIMDQRWNHTCCQPCECEEICKERETCCADKEGRDDAHYVVKQQCVPAMHEATNRGKTPTLWYYTRSHCPSSFAEITIKDKCEKNTYESLHDAIFVSSGDGSIVYKNEFCALCHGEKRTLPWAVELKDDCIRFFINGGITEADLIEILLTRCQLVFKRPDVFNSATLCSNTAVNQCNKTGVWDHYDEHVANLCLTPPETVYYYHKNGAVYSNLYCYLCNQRANVNPEVCNLNDLERFTVNSYIGLIDWNIWLPAEDTMTNDAIRPILCKRNQIRDTFFDTCRNLSCPVFSLPMNGRCVYFVDADIKFCLTVRLSPQQPLNKTELMTSELTSHYFDIIRHIGFRKCEICNVILYQNTAEMALSEVLFYFSVTTRASCTAEDISRKVMKLERASSYVDILLNQTIIRFNIALDNAGYQDLFSLEKIFTVGSRDYCKCIHLKRGSNCPKLTLTTNEYNMVLSHHVNANELSIYPVDNGGNDIIYVCCEKYILDSQTSGGHKQTPSIPVGTLLLVAFSQKII